jgi:hypothetical protein
MQFSFMVVVFSNCFDAMLKVCVTISSCDSWLTGIQLSVNVVEGTV